MERLSIFEIYKYYKKNPVLVIAFFVSAIGLNLFILEKIDPENPIFHLFKSKPSLAISISETERYSINSNDIFIKRIKIKNQMRQLKNVKISIRISEKVSEMKLIGEPNIAYRSTNFKDKLGNELIEIDSDLFEKDQAVEIRLVLTKGNLKKGKSNVVVEIVGAYGKDQFIGTSATSVLFAPAEKIETMPNN